MDRPAPGMDVPRGERYGAEPRISGGSGVATSYCVRLCDGRYFPIQRTSTSQAAQVCSALCPAAATKVFFGSDIARATARDGKRTTISTTRSPIVRRPSTTAPATATALWAGDADAGPGSDAAPRRSRRHQEGLVRSAGAQAYGKASDEYVTSGAAAEHRTRVKPSSAPRRSYNRRDNFTRHNTWQ